MMPVVDKQFPADTSSISQARQSVAELGASLSKEESQNMALLVSELVSNSILHGGLLSSELVGLRIYLSISLLRTEVRNAGSGFELGAGSLIGGGLLDNLPIVTQTSGWGLQLVAGLTDRWGVGSEEPEQMSKQMTLVWFEIDRKTDGPSKTNETEGAEDVEDFRDSEDGRHRWTTT
jgi:anti-sigma regulatory factor (Ser/Thr protein kinase)